MNRDRTEEETRGGERAIEGTQIKKKVEVFQYHRSKEMNEE